MSKTGKNVIIELVKPNFFFEYQRLELVNQYTDKATAFKKALRTMRKELGTKKKVDLVIPLPFKCEKDIVGWEVQGFTNKDEEIVKKFVAFSCTLFSA